MTLAHLVVPSALVDALTPEAASPVEVRVDVHDASRLEWSVSLPLPVAGRDAVAYTIAVEMDIPSNAFARHTPWDQLQSFTRLDGRGDALAFDKQVVTIDALRRSAVAVASQMARLGEAFSRRCVVAASLFTRVSDESLARDLTATLASAAALARAARDNLTREERGEPAELGRERQLVDEYVSERLLRLLAGAERGLEVLGESRATHTRALAETAALVQPRIADVLEAELVYRAERGYVCANPDSQETLEAYLDRASRLKKHFQEVLFLEAEVFQVAERLHHWAAALGALIASTWAFAWQIALVKRTAAAPTVGSGIVMLAVIAGFIYATKDRVKDIGKAWISGNVHRFYAQRVARYRAPKRRFPSRDVIVTARESFEQQIVRKPDPLNPESGSQVPSTLIRYSQRGKVLPAAASLAPAGVSRVKHVFRYDLSPLFARLDDAVKHVPVLDRATHRVRFSEAPRSYRFPVRVRVTCDAQVLEEEVVVVLHKGGLDRLERGDSAGPESSRRI